MENKNELNEEKKESLEVAIQCLETAFDIENQPNTEIIDLLSLITIKPKVEVTEEQKAQAEEHKNKGNNYMKNSEYDQAIAEYTKAIELNPYNAVYYCNRAAAYTRQTQDADAIIDCKEALKLDPTYGKAYGRLGIAYSNLNKYDLALTAYQSALKYDPNNAMYEANLKVAEQMVNSDAAAPTMGGRPLPDITQFLNNPNIINMASQILSDPTFCNMMSGIVNMGGTGEGMTNAVETMLQAGQTLAQRVASEDPTLYSRLTRNRQNNTTQGTQENGDVNNLTSSNSSGEQPPENKDQGSA
ncbi:hypothetical protein GWI33_002834 [Rhynchophorus ferrugineus]|uniref:SGTA homodimerisation domain-containing protein n=1 Tax=Rhynchophorus ferrugineus TaxID=354439 RepID=A0A834MP95_RHYFE|nr:hypothetical protein GWI33_002834 [Rhynchophorus ferrugineus]